MVKWSAYLAVELPDSGVHLNELVPELLDGQPGVQAHNRHRLGGSGVRWSSILDHSRRQVDEQQKSERSPVGLDEVLDSGHGSWDHSYLSMMSSRSE